MFEHLVDLETELEKLESQLPELYASGDQAAARDAGRRHAELKPVVDAYREYRRTEADVADARELLAAETDTEMREYLQGELAEREARLAELEATLKELLVPRDPNDGKNVIMRRRGQPVGGRPVRDVPPVRGAARLGPRGAVEATVRDGRLPRYHVRREGP